MNIQQTTINQRSLPSSAEKSSYIHVLILLSLAFFATRSAWSEMISAAWRSSEDSAALIALLGTGYLLWVRRERVSLSGGGNWLSVSMLMLALLCYLTGSLQEIRLLQQIGAVFVVCCTFCCLTAASSLWAILPIGLTLLFLIEVPSLARETISQPLAVANAHIVGEILGAVGIENEVLGTLVSAGQIELQVVDACDGLRLFWSVLLLTYIMCVAGSVKLRTALLMILMAPALALVANTLRILVVALAYLELLPKEAARIHDISGVLMMSCAWLLPFAMLRIWPTKHSKQSVSLKQLMTVRPLQRGPGMSACVGLIVLSGAAFAFEDTSPQPVRNEEQLRQLFRGLPFRIDRFVGESMQLPERQLDVLRPDALESRRYRCLDNSNEFLLIATMHVDGDRHLGHEPAKCYSALGWKVSGLTLSQLKQACFEIEHSVCRLVRTKRSREEQMTVHSYSLRIRPHENIPPALVEPSLTRLQLVFGSEQSFARQEQISEQLLQELCDSLLNAAVQ